MKKRAYTLIILLLSSLFVCSMTAHAETNYPSYTYDYWKRPLPAASPYVVERVILGSSIDISLPTDEKDAPKTLKYIEDIFVTETHYYIVDLQAAKIIVTDKRFNVERIIDRFEERNEDRSVVATHVLVRPRGIYVSDDRIYITDEKDQRQGAIYVLNHAFECIDTHERPNHPTYSSDIFRPNKIVVDRAKRMYVVVTGAFDGIVELQRDGTFSRFIGVQPVQFNPIDLLWRNFMSREQLARTRLFLPIEYTAMSIDKEGFIYATASGTSTAPIQRINPKGSDVLRKNGYVNPIGDVVRLPDQNRSGLTSIDVNDYGMYSVLDRTNKKVFTYNDEGYLAYVTGFEGDYAGNFIYPTTVKYDGDNLIVADSTDARTKLTVFTPTAFGSKVNRASELTYLGENIDAADIWEDILTMNSNYSLAYIGIGHAYYRDREYALAMENYRLGEDRINYSKAYKEYRRIRFEENFPLVGTTAAIIIFFLLARPIIRDLKKKE
jgi:hypothetical protein